MQNNSLNKNENLNDNKQVRKLFLNFSIISSFQFKIIQAI